MNAHPICNSPLYRSAQRSFAPLQKSPQKEITVLICEHKPYPVWFPCRRKSYPVLIEAKLTPSVGQVESDAVTALRANASEFMSFGHSIPIYSHFKTNFMVLKRLFHADAHANGVELFPVASRWMISCLAAVGCFHDLLITIEESVCGWFISTMYICSSSSISICREERQTVVHLLLA